MGKTGKKGADPAQYFMYIYTPPPAYDGLEGSNHQHQGPIGRAQNCGFPAKNRAERFNIGLDSPIFATSWHCQRILIFGAPVWPWPFSGRIRAEDGRRS